MIEIVQCDEISSCNSCNETNTKIFSIRAKPPESKTQTCIRLCVKCIGDMSIEVGNIYHKLYEIHRFCAYLINRNRRCRNHCKNDSIYCTIHNNMMRWDEVKIPNKDK